ncbi:MAG: hypothetical protein KJ638_13515 [Chloroflexi bacterium]|nr:hypothetical protein [Chloroflexota bacterium]
MTNRPPGWIIVLTGTPWGENQRDWRCSSPCVRDAVASAPVAHKRMKLTLASALTRLRFVQLIRRAVGQP